MRNIQIAAILGVFGILGFAESDTATEVFVGESGGFEVPEHLEPVLSWPPGSFVDCG